MLFVMVSAPEASGVTVADAVDGAVMPDAVTAAVFTMLSSAPRGAN